MRVRRAADHHYDGDDGDGGVGGSGDGGVGDNDGERAARRHTQPIGSSRSELALKV